MTLTRPLIAAGLVIAALAVSAGVVASATGLGKSVLGGGGGTSSSTNYELAGTAGQPGPIGLANSTNYELQSGFWYGAGPELIACGSGAEAADPDVDGLTNGQELTLGSNECDLDSDDDLCSDGEEAGPDRFFGGQRSPIDFWDFYDITGDSRIELSDALALLGDFGLGPLDAGYDPEWDRYIPNGATPWLTAQALGDDIGMSLQDVLASLQSFGHDCSAAP